MCGDLILSLWYIVLKIKTNRQVCQSPQIRSILRLSARVESAPVESESGRFAVCCVVLRCILLLCCVALCCVVLCCVVLCDSFAPVGLRSVMFCFVVLPLWNARAVMNLKQYNINQKKIWLHADKMNQNKVCLFYRRIRRDSAPETRAAWRVACANNCPSTVGSDAGNRTAASHKHTQTHANVTLVHKLWCP